MWPYTTTTSPGQALDVAVAPVGPEQVIAVVRREQAMVVVRREQATAAVRQGQELPRADSR